MLQFKTDFSINKSVWGSLYYATLQVLDGPLKGSTYGLVVNSLDTVSPDFLLEAYSSTGVQILYVRDLTDTEMLLKLFKLEEESRQVLSLALTVLDIAKTRSAIPHIPGYFTSTPTWRSEVRYHPEIHFQGMIRILPMTLRAVQSMRN